MMLIHTVAAGGGSILHFDGARFRVGPDSAGANPGPEMLPARRTAGRDRRQCDGRQAHSRFLSEDFRPRAEPAARRAARCAMRFADLAQQIGGRKAEEVADGFIKIAVENMANAIKKISVQRGYDVTRYALNCFGGAGGQHACLVADALGMTQRAHPPVLFAVCRPTAWGLPISAPPASRRSSCRSERQGACKAIARIGAALGEGRRKPKSPARVSPADKIDVIVRAHIRYAGTDTALVVPAGSAVAMKRAFEKAHKAAFRLHRSQKADDGRSRLGRSGWRRRQIQREER